MQIFGNFTGQISLLLYRKIYLDLMHYFIKIFSLRKYWYEDFFGHQILRHVRVLLKKLTKNERKSLNKL